jgi:hypothetical protein
MRFGQCSKKMSNPRVFKPARGPQRAPATAPEAALDGRRQAIAIVSPTASGQIVRR